MLGTYDNIKKIIYDCVKTVVKTQKISRTSFAKALGKQHNISASEPEIQEIHNRYFRHRATGICLTDYYNN